MDLSHSIYLIYSHMCIRLVMEGTTFISTENCTIVTVHEELSLELGTS